MDIGRLLHEARDRRGLTLEQVSRSTKIPLTVLDHLEHNRFDRLAGAIFVKGYLRAFAKSVGVDGEGLAQEYVRQSVPPPSRVVASSSEPLESATRVAARILPAALGLLAVIGVLYFAREMARRPLNDSTSPPERTSAPAPVATVGEAAAPASPTDRPFTWPVQMDMEVSGDCWVSAIADGQSVVYRLVRRGERFSITAEREVVLRIGDPTVFTYRVNGVPGRPVGRPGSPATVRINRETYRDFFDSPSKPTAVLGAR
jgi:cytoskeletal protein RodZ